MRLRSLRSIGDKLGESLQFIRIDPIHSRLILDRPGLAVVGRGPETDRLAIGVGLPDKRFQLGSLLFGNLTFATPLEVGGPAVADPWHQIPIGILFQVFNPPVATSPTHFLGGDGRFRDGGFPGDDNRDRPLTRLVIGELGQQIPVGFELFLQDLIGSLARPLEIDQQMKGIPIRVHASAVFFRFAPPVA